MLHQTPVTDILTGAEFNDYEPLYLTPLGDETEDTKLDFSTQVCDKHAKELKLADGLDEDMGTGTCGVVGCERPAIHNYYFFSGTDPRSVLKGKPRPTKGGVTRKVPTAEVPVALKGIQ